MKWFKKAYPKYEHSRFTTGVTTKAGSLSSAYDLSLFHDFKLTKPVRNDLLLGNFAYVNINWDIQYSQDIFKFYINDCNALGWRQILLTPRLSENFTCVKNRSLTLILPIRLNISLTHLWKSHYCKKILEILLKFYSKELDASGALIVSFNLILQMRITFIIKIWF